MNIYDEVEIEDMEFKYIGNDKTNMKNAIFLYQCPCGDKFVISAEQLLNGEKIAKCPSCHLAILVVYDKEFILNML